MSNSSRKDFDVKHILRLRWKLFSHPAAPAGGCLQPDGSFEHWGPSQSRLLKSQERSGGGGGGGAFWKKASSASPSQSSAAACPPPCAVSSLPLNGTSLPATRLHGLAEQQGPPPAPRTIFYVESLDERPGGGGGGSSGGDFAEFPRPEEKALVLREVKGEPLPFADGGGRATGEGAAHRLSATNHPLTPQCDMDLSTSEEFYQAVHHAEQTFRKMESYLKQQQLCDVILIAGNRKIPAH
ncbi:PREDICTED: kelch-like protein 1, partial [Thamnophis sirtalis]|uniref:Kelch-like protein 1 n=1 Tax=Thamnophis sirtalis TaxID=35019 RepID=A0A6I9Z501_9SAUR